MSAEPLPISIIKSTYTLSCFDREDPLCRHYHVVVEERSKGRWAVIEPMGSVLSSNGEWEDEPSPSSRTNEWLDSHRFSFETAMELAHKALPDIEANGVTAREMWKQKAEQ